MSVAASSSAAALALPRVDPSPVSESSAPMRIVLGDGSAARRFCAKSGRTRRRESMNAQRRIRLLLRGDPACDSLIEHIERKAAAAEDGVVELALIEMRAELLRRALAQLANLQLAELVAARLRRRRDVTICLRLDRRLIDRVRFAHEVDDLIARPVHVVNAGIDDETHRAEKLRSQTTVVRAGILIEPDFLPELLGIQRPTFRVSRVAAVLAELGESRQRLLNRELHVMAGNAFVIRDRFVVDHRAVLEV